MGRWDDAEASFRRALEIKPAYVKAVRGLGDVLWMQGKPDAAVASYRQALTVDGGGATVYNDLGNVLQQLGLLNEALASYASALAIDPRFVEAHSNAGRAHLHGGRIREAIDCQRQAIDIKPGFAEAHFNLANALRDGGRLGEAIASYRRALAIKPEFAIGYAGLGDVQKDTGSLREAQASFRRALEIDPELQDAHTSLLFCMSHDETVTPEVLFAEHRRFGDRFEQPLRAGWPAHRNARDPERPLRVGFVSADLRAHPMSYFIEPLLQHLVGDGSLSLHAYSNHIEEDAVTQRLRPHFRNWRRVAGVADERVAELIAEDGIDVLIDLSGHTSGNRLRVFARKPAPLQVSWLGYPGTTGLLAMDYYFGDAHFLPLAEFGSQFTERLVHLPALAPFLPDAGAPPVNALPALANGYLTFGSFNRPSKLRPVVVASWSQVLRALPDARMLIGGMPQDGQPDELAACFAREGVAGDRLDFHVRAAPQPTSISSARRRLPRHVSLFRRHDDRACAVDGRSHADHCRQSPAGRQGVAILGQVGLQEFVVTDAADFVRKGIALAGDLPALAALRAGMRARCEGAPHRRPEVVADGVNRALRIMWRRWCAGQPAESFASQ